MLFRLQFLNFAVILFDSLAVQFVVVQEILPCEDFVCIIPIFLIKTDNALCFLLSNVAVYFIVWIVLELNCRKLIGSKNDGNTFSFDELIKNIKAGILLTVGNLSSVVLTSMDRWFVKALMTTLAFAQYSFAVSMENFMNVAVTPVTTTSVSYTHLTLPTN